MRLPLAGPANAKDERREEHTLLSVRDASGSKEASGLVCAAAKVAWRDARNAPTEVAHSTTAQRKYRFFVMSRTLYLPVYYPACRVKPEGFLCSPGNNCCRAAATREAGENGSDRQ
jgi:hypothetical protein